MDNPGQKNIAYDPERNAPRLDFNVSVGEDTPLEDIQAAYRDIGDQYNNFVQDARANVHDRQVEHIGNNFGASPYNTNTYYGRGATSFASAVRQQGTQVALQTGMERGKKEAEDAYNAAQSAYNDATSAYNNAKSDYEKAYENYQSSKSNVTVATPDEGWLKEHGMTIEDFQNLDQYNGDRNAMMSDIINKYGMTDEVKDWYIDWMRDNSTDKVLAEFGHDRAWLDSLSDEERDAWWSRSDVGRKWSDYYAEIYMNNELGNEYYANWRANYDDYYNAIDNAMKYIDGEIDSIDEAFKTSIQPEGVSSFDEGLLDLISPKLEGGDPGSVEFPTGGGHLKLNPENNKPYYTEDSVFKVDGKEYTVQEASKMLSQYYGTDIDLTSHAALTFDKMAAGLAAAHQTYGAQNAKTIYNANAVSPNDLFKAAFGADVEAVKAYKKLRAEEPEMYEKVKDSVARALTDVSVFEVADGTKEFHTANGWEVLPAGTRVVHAPDYVLDDEGKIADPNLKKAVDLWADEDDPTVDEEQRVALIQQYGSAYARTLAVATALTPGDDVVDKTLYRSVLACMGDVSDSFVVYDGKTKQDIIDEFKKLADENSEKAYDHLANLMKNAYKGMGAFIAHPDGSDKGTVSVTALEDKNGVSTVGSVDAEFTDMDQSDAMAQYIILMQSMEDFGNGSTSKNINPDIFMSDGSSWLETAAAKTVRNLASDVDSIFGGIAMLCGVLGDMITGGSVARNSGGDIGTYIGLMASGSGTTRLAGASNMAELYGGDLKPGMIGYKQEINNRNSNLMREAVNPLTYMLWQMDPEGDTWDGTGIWDRTFGSGVAEFLQDAAAFGVAEGIEAVATMGISAAAKAGLKAAASSAAVNAINNAGDAAASAIKKGAKSAASGIASAADLEGDVLKASAKNLANSFKEGVAASAQNLLGQAWKSSVKSMDAGDIAAGMAKAAGKNVDDAAGYVAKKTLVSKLDDAVNTVTDAVANQQLKSNIKSSIKNLPDDALQRIAAGKSTLTQELNVAAEVAQETKDALNTAASAAVKNMDDIIKTADEAKDLSDQLFKIGTAAKLNDLEDYSEMTLKQASKQAAETATRNIAANSDEVVKTLNTALKNSTDDVIKGISYAANHVDNWTDAGKVWAKNVVNNVSDDIIKNTLKANGATRVTKNMISQAREAMIDSLAGMGQAAAQRTYQTALVSAFTGVSAETVARANGEILGYLSKMIGKAVDSGDLAGFGKLMGKMNGEGAKKVFGEIIETSALASLRNQSYTIQDAIRALAGKGWNSKRLALIAKRELSNFGEDAAHDIIRGYTMPHIDAEGNTVRTPIDEYISDPTNFLMPLALTAGKHVIGSTIRNTQAWRLQRSIQKAQKALAATDNTTPEYTKLLAKVQKQTIKAEKLSGKMLDKSLSYNQMAEVSEAGRKVEAKYMDGLYERMGISQGKIDEYDVMIKKAREQGDYKAEAEWLAKKVRTEDELRAAHSMVNSFALRNSMDIYRLTGNGKAGTLSTLTDDSMWMKINRVAYETAKKYTDAFRNEWDGNVWEKQARMRKLQIDAVVDALKGTDGSLPITNLRSGLQAIFDIYDNTSKTMVKMGHLEEGMIAPGYFSSAAMRIGKAGDDVPWFAKGLFLGSDQGNAIALSSPDPLMKSETSFGDLLTAVENGEKVFRKTVNGKNIEFDINTDGLNMVTGAIAYSNSNMVHRVDGSLLGSGDVDFGTASMRNSRAITYGAGNARRAITADIRAYTAELEDIKKSTLQKFRENPKKVIEAKAAAKKAQKTLADLPNTDPELFNTYTRAVMARLDAEDSLKTANAQLTSGVKAKGQLGFDEIFNSEYIDSNGRTHKLDTKYKYTDSDGKGVGGISPAEKAARDNVIKDIKTVQSGGNLSVNDPVYNKLITDAAKNNGAFTYDAVVYRGMIDNPGFIKGDVSYDLDAMRSQVNPEAIKHVYNGKEYDINNLHVKSARDADVIFDYLRTQLEEKAPKKKNGEVVSAYKQMITDALATTRTQIADSLSSGDDYAGFNVVADILRRNLPDGDKFAMVYDSGLHEVVSSISNMGMTVEEWKAGIAELLRKEIMNGKDGDAAKLRTYGRALALVDQISDSSQRYTGSGGFDPGKFSGITD